MCCRYYLDCDSEDEKLVAIDRSAAEEIIAAAAPVLVREPV